MPSLASSYYRHKYSKRRFSTILTILVCLGLFSFAVTNQQNINDWWKLRFYKPPASILALGNSDTMTAQATKVFEVNHPSLEDKTSFNTNCPNNGGEKTIVLGCYHSNQNGIFLLSVSDSRLNGVEQVTAAHEMLHAAYDRLSQEEKNYVNGLLLDYYSHDLHDPRLISTINAYKQSEPNDVVNEMHSVFGTEISNLTPALEQYYKQYFVNRQQIAAYAAQYEAEFSSRQTIVTQDDAQLSSWKGQISNLETDLNGKLNSINSLKNQLTALKDSGNISAYNAGVSSYNQQVDSYNGGVSQLKSLISSYNNVVVQRNNIALVENQLYQELNASNTTLSH